MIIEGKPQRKEITSLDKIYARHKLHLNLHLILLPRNKTLAEYAKELFLNNAIVSDKYTTFFTIILGRDFKEGGNNYSSFTPDIFESKISVIKNGAITEYKSACEVCVNRLKGITGECKEKVTYGDHFIPNCEWSFDLAECNIDLRDYHEVKTTMINSRSPFQQNRSLEDFSFDLATIKTNKQVCLDRREGIDKKKIKLEKYCSRCIFRCEKIDTERVKNHCMLTYEQALETGFFKDIEFVNATSIYRIGVYYKNKIQEGGGNYYSNVMREAGHETKYTREDK